MSNPASSGTGDSVLIVEDERELGELYKQWLGDAYRVTSVASGEDAIEVMDRDWCAVLLDRRMPGMSGDAVLTAMREAGHDYPVAMVTAVEPDFDIIEMGFDDYVVKPVNRSDLHDLVGRLMELTDYDSGMQRYFSLASKKATLEANKTKEQLDDNVEYQTLLRQIEEVQHEVAADRDHIVKNRTSDAAFRERLEGKNLKRTS